MTNKLKKTRLPKAGDIYMSQTSEDGKVEFILVIKPYMNHNLIWSSWSLTAQEWITANFEPGTGWKLMLETE